MSGETVGFISIGIMVVINIITTAYSYGRFTEKVTAMEKDLGRRVTNLEHGTNVCMGHNAIEERLRSVEVKIHD